MFEREAPMDGAENPLVYTKRKHEMIMLGQLNTANRKSQMAHRTSAVRNRRNDGLFQQFLLFIKIELNIPRRKQEDPQHNHTITIAARLPKLYAEILQRPPGSIIDGHCYDASENE